MQQLIFFYIFEQELHFVHAHKKIIKRDIKWI